MAFSRNRWTRTSSSSNVGYESVGGVDFNGPAIFGYGSEDDAAATVVGADYFASVSYDLAVGDLIFADCSDSFSCLVVSAVTRGDSDDASVTTAAAGFSTGIGTANILNDAVTTAKILDANVTFAKIEDIAVTSILGNSTAGEQAVEEITLGAGLEFSGTTIRQPLAAINHVRVLPSLAEFIAGNTTPMPLVAAAGAGTMIVLHRAQLSIDYGGTVLAGGGTLQVCYGVADVAATVASNTLAAATAIAATADTTFGFSPVDTTLVDSGKLNVALNLSVDTADFTGGTASAYMVDVWYSVVDYT